MKLIELTALEARIIGSLIEKQITTPDQYPLSLNSLVAACNQKSNRDPVLELDESTVRGALDGLIRKHLVIEKSGFGSRVPKFQHRFCNTEFGTLKFTPQELAIVCELLLRGPQTPGELRSRASRMAAFTDSGALEGVLEELARRQDGPIVARLAREPGRRESRYAQLFTGPAPGVSGPSDPESESAAPASQAGAQSQAAAPSQASFAALEQRVEHLEAELRALKERLDATPDSQGPADR